MKKRVLYLCIAVSALLCGCVTPQAIKEASTNHAQNLNQLQQSTETYRAQAASDYDRRIDLQKQAYIAQRVSSKIDALTENLIGAAAAAAQPTVDDKPSRDFITFAGELREEYRFEGDNFNFWLTAAGDDVDAKKKTITDQATALEQTLTTLKNGNNGGENDSDIRRREHALKGLRAALEATPDALAHVSAAVEFAKQKTLRLAKLDLLLQQIKVMKSFHAVVDDYLAIDATIDAGAIAKAAAAGSKMDLTGLTELQQVIGGK